MTDRAKYRVQPTSRVGRRGEALAAEHLRRAGLQILDRNWRSGRCELDLVARDGAIVAFVEVKTRAAGPQHPLESVTRRQMRFLRRAAAAWIHAHPGVGREFRFDLVGVELQEDGSARVHHVPGAFTGDDTRGVAR
jgi:putative endonuclease